MPEVELVLCEDSRTVAAYVYAGADPDAPLLGVRTIGRLDAPGDDDTFDRRPWWPIAASVAQRVKG